jgi:hypothetical protein
LPAFSVASAGAAWNAVRTTAFANGLSTYFMRVYLREGTSGRVRVGFDGASGVASVMECAGVGNDFVYQGFSSFGLMSQVGKTEVADGWLYAFAWTPNQVRALVFALVGPSATTAGQTVELSAPMVWQGSPDAPLVEGTRAADTLALPLTDFPQSAGTAVIEFAEPIALPNTSSARLNYLDVNDTHTDDGIIYTPEAASTAIAGGTSTADLTGLSVDALASAWDATAGEQVVFYRTSEGWAEAAAGAYSGTHDVDAHLHLLATTGSGAGAYQIARTGLYEGRATVAWLDAHYPAGGA